MAQNRNSPPKAEFVQRSLHFNRFTYGWHQSHWRRHDERGAVDTMPPTVRDYFRNPPFRTLAGSLSVHTGENDFAELKIHETLQKQIEEYFKTRPVTVTILVGDQGGGKTWTLSWLYRTFM